MVAIFVKAWFDLISIRRCCKIPPSWIGLLFPILYFVVRALQCFMGWTCITPVPFSVVSLYAFGIYFLLQYAALPLWFYIGRVLILTQKALLTEKWRVGEYLVYV